LAAVIVVIVETVSKETGSDLYWISGGVGEASSGETK
jgi:hypothetical protein